MSRSRLLTPLVLLPAVVLATASCTAAPPVQEVARVVVPAPDDGPDGSYAQARAVHPGPDGTLLVTVGTVLPEVPATLGVVDPDTGDLRATAALAAGTDPDTAFGWEGSAVVAGTVWPGAGPIGYALQVVDPGSGGVTASLPVALPEGATLGGSAAVLGSDGVLYLAVSRLDAGPVLLGVDPGTGGVLTSAPLDLGDAGEDGGQVVVTDVAAAPDAGTVAVVAQVLDGHAVVVTVGADLAPLRDPVVLAPDWPSSTAGRWPWTPREPCTRRRTAARGTGGRSSRCSPSRPARTRRPRSPGTRTCSSRPTTSPSRTGRCGCPAARPWAPR